MRDQDSLEAQLLALRLDFDQTFARASEGDVEETAAMLEITVGSARFVIALDDVRGLHVDRPITAVPTRVSSLLGVVGIRGVIVAAHDLGVLLGVAVEPNPRWLVVSRHAPIAFGFSSLERHLRVKPDAVIARATESGALAAEVVIEGQARRTLVDLGKLAQQLTTPLLGSPQHAQGG